MGFDFHTVGEDEHGKQETFRLNIWGMGFYMDAMMRLGMVYPCTRGRWPEADREDPSVQAFLRSHPGDTPGIPSFKFHSNDGWVVTPGECMDAVAAWHRTPEEEREQKLKDARIETDNHRAYWAEWIDYLTLSASRGGMEVW